jgi:hypothetical protein
MTTTPAGPPGAGEVAPSFPAPAGHHAELASLDRSLRTLAASLIRWERRGSAEPESAREAISAAGEMQRVLLGLRDALAAELLIDATREG